MGMRAAIPLTSRIRSVSIAWTLAAIEFPAPLWQERLNWHVLSAPMASRLSPRAAADLSCETWDHPVPAGIKALTCAPQAAPMFLQCTMES